MRVAIHDSRFTSSCEELLIESAGRDVLMRIPLPYAVFDSAPPAFSMHASLHPITLSHSLLSSEATVLIPAFFLHCLSRLFLLPYFNPVIVFLAPSFSHL